MIIPDLTAGEKIRLAAIELAARQYKDALVLGAPPEATWLVNRAKVFERYITAGGSK